MQIKSVRPVLGHEHDAIYAALAHFPPGLMLDVGAAAGSTTKFMLDASPESRVVAFEPFEGNHRFFEDRHSADPRVTLHKAAVGERTGTGRFVIGSTVTKNAGRVDRIGYSSLGYLLPEDSKRRAQTVEIPTMALDDVVGDERVRFLKIDVQGGELGVLKSIARTIADDRLDIAYVEHQGEWQMMQFLVQNGLQVFAHSFVVMQDEPGTDLSEWELVEGATLTTGRSVRYGFPRAMPAEPEAFCAWLRGQRETVGRVWTDLIVVRPGMVGAFTALGSKSTAV